MKCGFGAQYVVNGHMQNVQDGIPLKNTFVIYVLINFKIKNNNFY